ncbi:MAG: hypothetical protein L6R40_008097 [Gallowayella cf. fulva]|nr:MAG: hypothetical protein L6R40_008097 [Xanthomendoza cf. fulva]
MGWFWVDNPSPNAPHPIPKSNATPPPECPMHNASSQTVPFPPRSSAQGTPSGSCPVRAPNEPLSSSNLSTMSKLNPLNYMPSSISQSRDDRQTIHLPTERESSSIPRGDIEGNWEYPSPQQMYNAMLRKGYDDTPEDAVESMVAVHNFLNEGAWGEIVAWERRFSRGLGLGWQACRRGEEGFIEQADKMASSRDVAAPKLLRFMGRPNEMTPKARILDFMGKIYPAKYGCAPPFDRHDWYVQRRTVDGQTKEVRYVIDYYSAPPEPTGEPVFYLDVRPAVDSPTAAVERMMRWGGDVWYRASGAKARETAS